MKRKYLQGYVENRTKEAALAAIMMALFFVARTYKIQVLPFFLLDLTGSFIFTSASLFSWPYTLIFSGITFYQASNPIAVVAYLVGTQTIFSLTKIFDPKWSKYLPFTGEVTGWLAYGVLLKYAGTMAFRPYLVLTAFPQLICTVTTYAGGLLIWRWLRRFGFFERSLATH